MSGARQYGLERTIVIQASRELVFSFFTDNARWSSWWGAQSTIEPRPGGRVYIRHPNGVEVSGEVVEVSPRDRIVFTYGYVAGTPIPAGGSLVTIALEDHETGTRLRLTHEFDDENARDQHVRGWRFQLSLFANVAANLAFSGAAGLVDAWFQAWAELDGDARRQRLSAVVAPGVTFRDRFSCLAGLDELSAHIGAAHRFMPGITTGRDGDVQHCQGTLLVGWVAVGADGQQRGRGTNVFTLGADGLVQAVTGFWAG